MIRLKGITWTNPRGYLPLAASSAVWNVARPEVAVEWEQFPWYEFEDQVISSLQARKGKYDLIMFDHPWTGTLAAEGWLTPWNSLLPQEELRSIEARTIMPSFQSYVQNDLLWALPLDSACHAGLYRSDQVTAEELPARWDLVEGWAREHQSSSHPYPLALSLEGVLGSCLFLSLMNGLGCPPYLDPESPTCDRTAATHILRMLKPLLAYAPPDSQHWGPWDIYQHFITSDDLLYSPSIFAYVNYFGETGRSAALKLTSVPDMTPEKPGTPILGGVGLGIDAASRFQREAGEFGRYLMSDAVQTNLFPQHFGQPSAVKVWKDPVLNLRIGDFYLDLASGMNRAYIRPTYAGFHAFELSIGRALQKWWDDECSLTTTLDSIHAI